MKSLKQLSEIKKTRYEILKKLKNKDQICLNFIRGYTKGSRVPQHIPTALIARELETNQKQTQRILLKLHKLGIIEKWTSHYQGENYKWIAITRYRVEKEWR